MLLSTFIAAATLAAPAMARYEWKRLQRTGTNTCLDNQDGRLADGNPTHM